MPSNIAGLVNNIRDSAEALLGDLGIIQKKAQPGLYPTAGLETVLAFGGKIAVENWNKTSQYSFVVEAPAGSANSPFGEFTLPLNPSELNQDETFAISLKTTQGGTVVQHGGNRYKDLIISGTTGIAPFRGAGGVQKSTGKAIFQPDQLKYRSGYEVFLSLRNWFRAYYQYKNVNHTADAKKLRLIFRNFKDGEFLIVELIKFGLKRSSTRRYLYDYNLQFKVLGHVDFRPKDEPLGFLNKVDNFINSAVDKIDTARGVFMRSQDILRQVESTYENAVLEPLRKTSMAAKAFLGIGTVAADMGKKVVSSTVTEAAALGILLGIVNNPSTSGSNASLVQKSLSRAQNQARVGGSAGNAQSSLLGLFDKSDALMSVDSSAFPESSLNALALEQEQALALPRSFYENAISELKRVRDNAIDKFALGDPDYDAFFNRTPTLSAEPGKTITDDEVALLDAFNQAIKGLEEFLASNAIFKSTYDQRIADVNDKFDDEISLIAEKAVKELIMPTNTDLERIALRELGDSSRWVEIAELNNLKPPYVVQDLTDTSENVVKPGDTILIPAPIVFGFGTAPKAKSTFFTENLSEVEKNLGVDLKITKDFDLELTNTGDLKLSVGAENAAQAIVLKLMLERGDLLKHPEIGVGVEPGKKFPGLSDIKTAVIQSLKQDPRFEDVKNLIITRENSELRMKFEVKVKNVDVPVPVDVKL